MSVRDTLATKLEAAFTPTRIDIVDESHLHQGHMGARPEGETHFRVVIVSAAFEGLSRVDRQRRVHSVLDAELAGPVHALALRTLTPGEDAVS